MDGIGRMCTSSLLILCLICGVLSSVSYGNVWFIEARADATIEFATLSSADRKIFYLTAERSESMEIKVRDGSEASTVITHEGTDHLPRGISVSPEVRPRSPDSHEFLIHIDKSIQVAESQMPITYGINFDNPRTTEGNASILFVIEAPDINSRPLPIVSFDKSFYSADDQATVTVNDPHIECVVPESSADGTTTVQVDLTLNGNILAGSPFTLTRDQFSNNEYRHILTLPAGAGTLEAKYISTARDCVIPPEPTTEFSAMATLSGQSISFDRQAYVYQDTATITVRDNSGSPRPITFSASLNAESVMTEVNVNDAYRIGIPLPATAANTYTLMTRFQDLFPSFQEGYITLSATYGELDQESVTIVPESKLLFVIPDGRTSYFTNDTASLVLMGPQFNSNELDFDSWSVTLCSYDGSSGMWIDGAVSLVPFAETGRNTGILVNSYHLSFINADFNYGLLPPGDETIFQQSSIRILMGSETKILAKQDNFGCPIQIPATAGPMQAIVSVNPSEASDPDATGRGQSYGPVDHEDPPLYAVSQVNCGQLNYGYDLDTDGICDNWETTSGVKVYYPAGGSSWTLTYTNDPAPKPDHRDVFVEIDHIDNTAGGGSCNDGRSAGGNNWKLTTAPVNNVEAAFRSGHVDNDDGISGVELHIYLDDKVTTTPTDNCIEQVNTWGIDTVAPIYPSYDELKRDNFGRDSTERLTTDKGKAKFQVFHYGISIPKQHQDTASSGVAENTGNDFVVSMGAGSPMSWSTNHIQGTLMHELGHNLGLYHGGPDLPGNDYNVNCKPNYPSVMTYIRQINTPYTNNSLTFSDDTMTPLSIDSDNPGETNVLDLSSSWLSLVELVWGIDPGAVGGPITVLSGDAVADPGVAGDVGQAPSDIDWNGNGAIAASNPPGFSIANLGIPGCDGSDSNPPMISGANDWANLRYNFRNLNPDAFETGFGPRQYYPLESNSTIIGQVYAKGINTTDFLVETLDDDIIIEDGSCSDVQFTPDAASYNVGDTITVEIEDADANRDPDSHEEKMIRVTSTSDPVGVEFVARETGGNTGIFILEVDTSAAVAMGKLTVSNGDEVTIEYTDECAGHPTKGWDYKIVIKIGSVSYSIMNMTVAEKVKSEFHEKLVSAPHEGDNDYITGSVSNATLIELVTNGDFNTAVQELLTLRQYMDGIDGGNATDDLFKEEWKTQRALNFLTNNIAALKEANNTAYEEPDAFVVTSYDWDCEDDGTPLGCTVSGYSETATAVADTFRIDADEKMITFDLTGQGDVTLEIPGELVTHVFGVQSAATGGGYEFDVQRNATVTSVKFEDLSYYPRKLLMSYWADIVSPLSIGLESIVGDPLRIVRVGDQVAVDVELRNQDSAVQPYAAIIEIRDSDGVTLSLDWVEGSINGKNLTNVGISWTPEEAEVYELRTFVITNLTSPEILSQVLGKNITVYPVPTISSDSTSYEVGDSIAVTIADPAFDASPDVDLLNDIEVSSTTDAVGLQFDAPETAENSGMFTFTFDTSPESASGKLVVENGDSVTIEYKDQGGAEFSHTIMIEDRG